MKTAPTHVAVPTHSPHVHAPEQCGPTPSRNPLSRSRPHEPYPHASPRDDDIPSFPDPCPYPHEPPSALFPPLWRQLPSDSWPTRPFFHFPHRPTRRSCPDARRPPDSPAGSKESSSRSADPHPGNPLTPFSHRRIRLHGRHTPPPPPPEPSDSPCSNAPAAIPRKPSPSPPDPPKSATPPPHKRDSSSGRASPSPPRPPSVETVPFASR